MLTVAHFFISVKKQPVFNLKTWMCFLLALFLISGCKNNEKQKEEGADLSQYKEPLIEANKHIISTEDQHIADFISRYGWNMQKTGTGLRYMIIREGEGQKAEEGLVAVLDYQVRLITGDVVYSSNELGNKEFRIGKGGVEAGLEEAVLLMRRGGKGRFILPAHLAFGLLGDLDKIPPKATLIYDITLLDLK